jgi:hypothetical protein
VVGLQDSSPEGFSLRWKAKVDTSLQEHASFPASSLNAMEHFLWSIRCNGCIASLAPVGLSQSEYCKPSGPWSTPEYFSLFHLVIQDQIASLTGLHVDLSRLVDECTVGNVASLQQFVIAALSCFRVVCSGNGTTPIDAVDVPSVVSVLRFVLAFKQAPDVRTKETLLSSPSCVWSSEDMRAAITGPHVSTEGDHTYGKMKSALKKALDALHDCMRTEMSSPQSTAILDENLCYSVTIKSAQRCTEYIPMRSQPRVHKSKEEDDRGFYWSQLQLLSALHTICKHCTDIAFERNIHNPASTSTTHHRHRLEDSLFFGTLFCLVRPELPLLLTSSAPLKPDCKRSNNEKAKISFFVDMLASIVFPADFVRPWFAVSPDGLPFLPSGNVSLQHPVLTALLQSLRGLLNVRPGGISSGFNPSADVPHSFDADTPAYVYARNLRSFKVDAGAPRSPFMRNQRIVSDVTGYWFTQDLLCLQPESDAVRQLRADVGTAADNEMFARRGRTSLPMYSLRTLLMTQVDAYLGPAPTTDAQGGNRREFDDWRAKYLDPFTLLPKQAQPLPSINPTPVVKETQSMTQNQPTMPLPASTVQSQVSFNPPMKEIRPNVALSPTFSLFPQKHNPSSPSASGTGRVSPAAAGPAAIQRTARIQPVGAGSLRKPTSIFASVDEDIVEFLGTKKSPEIINISDSSSFCSDSEDSCAMAD